MIVRDPFLLFVMYRLSVGVYYFVYIYILPLRALICARRRIPGSSNTFGRDSHGLSLGRPTLAL